MPSKTHHSTIMHVEESLHVVAPTAKHSHTIIFLHGRESTASEFAAEFFESQASNDRTLPEIFPSVKWVFPNSGLRKQARFNTEESQWFDMWDVKYPLEHKETQIEGLRESIAFILRVIREEASIIQPERVILGGISQGCATAIHALLYGGIRLGGFIGLSSWLPFQDDIEQLARYSSSNCSLLHNIRRIFNPKGSNNKSIMPLTDDTYPNLDLAFKTPIFISHSKDDKTVPFKNGDQLQWDLEEVLGFDVTFKAYKDGGHWVNEPQGVDDIVAFVRKHVIHA